MTKNNPISEWANALNRHFSKEELQIADKYTKDGGSIPGFLGNLHPAFQNGHPILQSHQQCMSVPFPPFLANTYFLLVFLVIPFSKVR